MKQNHFASQQVDFFNTLQKLKANFKRKVQYFHNKLEDHHYYYQSCVDKNKDLKKPFNEGSPVHLQLHLPAFVVTTIQ